MGVINLNKEGTEREHVLHYKCCEFIRGLEDIGELQQAAVFMLATYIFSVANYKKEDEIAMIINVTNQANSVMELAMAMRDGMVGDIINVRQ